jgi:class 3 adenylate cyclase/tetratricopeptide (TPR) repeat protein
MAAVTQAAELLDRVRAAERRGDFLGAFDLARRGLDVYPDDLKLAHRAILSLARSGATVNARSLLDRVGTRDDELVALDARLCKDEALAARGSERQRLARDAASRYAALFERNGAAYPAINAATLHLIAGDDARAAELAERALAITLAEVPNHGDPLDDYWRAATAAEAALVLGRLDVAEAKLVEARRANTDDHAALATTKKQLTLVCALRGVDASLVDALRPPAVAHYSGHMIGERFGPASEGRVAARIADVLATRDVGYGFGALASGSDILFAEALRARGAELHVVLPFEQEQFIATSVATAGDGWVRRFHECIAAASSITYGTLDASRTDTDALFAYGGQLAMGLALLRAGFLATDPVQIAVWDGKPGKSVAGTAADIATWHRRGLLTEVVSVNDAPTSLDDAGTSATPSASVMSVKAILFGDIKGFSKLRERDVPMFVDKVLGTFGRVLDECEVETRNTWGDGLYLVLPNASAAARCASRLQAAMRTMDLEGLRADMGLRLAGHVGPVFDCYDAVQRQQSFFGSHVTRTARMEPVTPEGEVFVTEQFAAALALGGDDFACEYVGDVPAAKGFGNLRMCVLKPRTLEGK